MICLVSVESLCVLFHFLLQNCFWIDVNAINKCKHLTDYLTSQIMLFSTFAIARLKT